MLILLALLVPSCATTASQTDKAPAYNPCLDQHEMILDHRDVMADKDKRAVLAYDCWGVRMGCWTAPPNACKAPVTK